MVDEQKLRQLAEAATPGHWDHWQSGGIHQIDAATKTVVHWSGFDQLQTPNEKNAIKDNAAYIAAANPAAILSLLDELQTLREERTEWRVTAENAESALTLTDETTTQLREQVAAIEPDSARYRWLLSNWFTLVSTYHDGGVQFTTGVPRWSDQPKETVSDAIDAAMKDES